MFIFIMHLLGRRKCWYDWHGKGAPGPGFIIGNSRSGRSY